MCVVFSDSQWCKRMQVYIDWQKIVVWMPPTRNIIFSLNCSKMHIVEHNFRFYDLSFVATFFGSWIFITTCAMFTLLYFFFLSQANRYFKPFFFYFPWRIQNLGFHSLYILWTSQANLRFLSGLSRLEWYSQCSPNTQQFSSDIKSTLN